MATSCIHDCIFHTTHNCNSDTIFPILPFSQLAFDFMCIVPALVLPRLVLAVGENTPSSSPLTNLQKLSLLGASGSRCVVKVANDHQAQIIQKSKFIYLQIIQYEHKASHHNQLKQYACAPSCTCNFPACGGAPLSHITGESLLFQLWPLLWSVVHVAVHFRLFREHYSRARRKRKMQAHPAPRPSPLITSHGAVSLFQFTVC